MRDVCVVMPVFNERITVREAARRVLARKDVAELVAVDDGSTDGSREMLEELARAEPRLKVLAGPHRGKGAALRLGLQAVQAPFVVLQDADLEYDVRDYDAVLAPLRDGKADVVYGSRFAGGPRRVLYFWHSLGNRAITGLSNVLNDLNLTDVATGMKAFRKNVVQALELKSDGFEVEAELTAKVAAMHYRIFEVPIAYDGREFWEGKKADWRAGLATLATLVRYARLDEFDGEDQGHLTLRAMETASSYADWLARKMRPHLGARVLEVGAGIGTITRHLLDRELVVALEPELRYHERLQNLFGRYSHVITVRGSAADDAVLRPLAAHGLDSVVLSNVLEHIEDDVTALRRFREILRPGGNVVVVAPALPGIYGRIDEAVGHFRRYSRASLSGALQQAGFEVERLEWLNLIGIAGWFVNGRLLRRRAVPAMQLKLYDRVAPLLARTEDALGGPPVGMSLLAVGRAPGAGSR